VAEYRNKGFSEGGPNKILGVDRIVAALILYAKIDLAWFYSIPGYEDLSA
jgi:hypothetical protein